MRSIEMQNKGISFSIDSIISRKDPPREGNHLRPNNRLQPDIIDRPEQILTQYRSDKCLDSTADSQQEEHLDKQQNTQQDIQGHLDCSSSSNQENINDSSSSK